ncbi:MAG: Kazal-type serine protease inhibitor family protein [Cytophagaceae bacterium]
MRAVVNILFTGVFFSCACGQNTGSQQNQTQNGAEAGCIDSTKIRPDMACIEIFEPVCGCDEKTYPNSCYAERMGVTKWEEGECRK